MDPVGPERSKDTLGQAHAKTSRSPTPELADGNVRPGGCSGLLHPELQARLQRMGINMRGTAAPVAALKTGAISESRGNHKAEKDCSEAEAVVSNVGEGAGAEESLPSARDASLDDMLLQLSDLDARSRALQAQGEKMSRKLSESRHDHGTTGMASARRTRSNGEAVSQQPDESRNDGGAAGGNRRASPSNAAQAVVKQHPLQGLTLMTGTADFQRHGPRQRRHERPPMAPVTVPGVAAAHGKEPRSGRRSLSSATAACTASVASEIPNSVPASPSSARGPKKKCDRVALPPLKQSTSAPGRLNSDGGPWARCRGR